jgi:hypothetical protein
VTHGVGCNLSSRSHESAVSAPSFGNAQPARPARQQPDTMFDVVAPNVDQRHVNCQRRFKDVAVLNLVIRASTQFKSPHSHGRRFPGVVNEQTQS